MPTLAMTSTPLSNPDSLSVGPAFPADACSKKEKPCRYVEEHKAYRNRVTSLEDVRLSRMIAWGGLRFMYERSSQGIFLCRLKVDIGVTGKCDHKFGIGRLDPRPAFFGIVSCLWRERAVNGLGACVFIRAAVADILLKIQTRLFWSIDFLLSYSVYSVMGHVLHSGSFQGMGPRLDDVSICY